MTTDRIGTASSIVLPAVGLVVVLFTFGSTPAPALAVLLAVLHVALVIIAVGHAEAIAHRVGEPFGTLVLALAVTVIEVSLVLMLMITKPESTSMLARDTVFAAIMIVCNGVVGLSIIVRSRREHIVRFSEQGANALLGTVMTIATLALVLPTFTSSSEGNTFTGSQFAFAAVSAFVVYSVFVFVQTIRHRWMFLSPDALDDEADDELAHVTAREPRDGRMDGLLSRSTLLVVSLVGVIGLAKVLAPRIEETVAWFGAPQAFVGVVIAVMILLPESVAAIRAAHRGEMQTSLNLSLGSALASIGLTIPAIAIASIWLEGPIVLGLGPTGIVLLALTAVIGTLTFGSGRATVLQGAQHLAVFAAFVFLSLVP
ncbi:MAG: ionic transporter y4hA [Acidimicrobiia bacterium]|nr:ionic transporter y4hA [Acidimicrobiia bacterium]